MSSKSLFFSVLLALTGLGALQPSATAQEGDPGQDPPAQAARLSYEQGSIALQPAGVSDWTAPAINRPLTIGDQLWSDGGSRAEIEFSSAALRMNENSSLSLLDLSDQGVQLRLSSGSIEVSVRAYDPNSGMEIDAPNAAVSLLQPGEYRVDVDDAGNTLLTVRSGAAQATDSAGRSITLQPGQAGQFGANGAFDVANVEPADEFDRWSEQREQRWVRNASVGQYVADDVVGAEDLGNYGQWQQVPDYGYVWFPTRVAYDWAPYSDGHWLWVAPWGWTWVDNAPWGYAPFHYGRWTYFNQHWGWVPAPPRHRAVYAPALVAWIGGPGNGAGVGWLPLAPGEVYVPGYRVSSRYAQNINISNTTIVNTTYITNVYGNPGLQNHYANHGAPRGITVVAQNDFVSGRGIAGHTIGAQPWQRQQPTARAPGIVPARASVLGPDAGARVGRPPERVIDRPVLGRRPPPPVPEQFDRQVDAMRANHGRPIMPPRTIQDGSFNNPNVHVVQSQPSVTPTPQQPQPGPRDQGARIPERSPGFQRPPQQQQQPEISTEQQQRNWNEQRNGRADSRPTSQPPQPQSQQPAPATVTAPQPQRDDQPRDSRPNFNPRSNDQRSDRFDSRQNAPQPQPTPLQQRDVQQPQPTWQLPVQRAPVVTPPPRVEPAQPRQQQQPAPQPAQQAAPVRQAPVFTPPQRQAPTPQQQQQQQRDHDRSPAHEDNQRRGRNDTAQP